MLGVPVGQISTTQPLEKTAPSATQPVPLTPDSSSSRNRWNVATRLRPGGRPLRYVSRRGLPATCNAARPPRLRAIWLPTLPQFRGHGGVLLVSGGLGPFGRTQEVGKCLDQRFGQGLWDGPAEHHLQLDCVDNSFGPVVIVVEGIRLRGFHRNLAHILGNLALLVRGVEIVVAVL